MELAMRWVVCVLYLLPIMSYRCYSSPLTSAADPASEQRRKRSTAINDENVWSPDDDSEVSYCV